MPEPVTVLGSLLAGAAASVALLAVPSCPPSIRPLLDRADDALIAERRTEAEFARWKTAGLVDLREIPVQRYACRTRNKAGNDDIRKRLGGERGPFERVKVEKTYPFEGSGLCRGHARLLFPSPTLPQNAQA